MLTWVLRKMPWWHQDNRHKVKYRVYCCIMLIWHLHTWGDSTVVKGTSYKLILNPLKGNWVVQYKDAFYMMTFKYGEQQTWIKLTFWVSKHTRHSLSRSAHQTSIKEKRRFYWLVDQYVTRNTTYKPIRMQSLKSRRALQLPSTVARSTHRALMMAAVWCANGIKTQGRRAKE